MNQNEGQPFGQNPEWEINREQNIAIAKKVDALLLNAPDSISKIMEMKEKKGLSDEEFIERVKIFSELYPEFESIESIEDIAFLISIIHLTQGYFTSLHNVNDRHKRIFLGVVYSDEYEDKAYVDIDNIPETFNFPAYIIIQRERIPVFASTLNVELSNYKIGADGLLYNVKSYDCFNFSGQGTKVETMTRMGMLEDEFDDPKAAEQILTKVNFVPQEEHSRAVPLTPDDYAKINNMFNQIDAGLYKFRS